MRSHVRFTALLMVLLLAVACQKSQPPTRSAAEDGGPAFAPGALELISAAEIPRKEQPVRTWDFLLGKEAWDWQFPAAAAEPTEKGARYTTQKNGPGPALSTIGLDASDFCNVRVRMLLTRQTEQGEEPAQFKFLRLYWARPTDIRGNEWPFSEERAVTFQQSDPATPEVWSADPTENRNWDGAIERMFVGVNLPGSGTAPPESFNVYTRGIEFIDVRNDPSSL